MFRVQHLPRHREWLARHLADVQGDGAYRLARKVEQALIEGNRADRLRGVDKQGRPLKPLKAPRAGRYRGATGPVLVPFDDGSDAIRGFFARISKNQLGWIIKVGIESAKAYIFAFHAEGVEYKNGYVSPRRDILGVTPKTKAAIRQVFKDWASGLFRSR